MPLTRYREPIAAEPTEQASLDLLTRFFAEGCKAPQLMHPDERPTDIPHSLYEVFKEALPILLRGDMVSIVPVNRLLTTQEAANLLNVSREYVRRLIQSGEIPHINVGRHHRIPFSDLMLYRQHRNTVRREALRNITHLGEESGYFD
jgi:excisionase family DNA binding protein